MRRMKEKIYQWNDTCVRKTTKRNALIYFHSLIEETFDKVYCRRVIDAIQRKFARLCCERLNRTSTFPFKIAANRILNIHFYKFSRPFFGY